MRKVLFSTWVTSAKGTIGIVLFEDEYGKREIRCSAVNGENEKADIQYIDDWGGLIDPADLIKFAVRCYAQGGG